jgi:CAAX prenyl protease-like protein
MTAPTAEEPTVDQLNRAHVIPFAVFMGFTMLLQVVVGLIGWKHPDAPWWRRDPAHFIYPLQTVAALALVVRYWRFYRFNWSAKWSLVAVVFGVVGISFWLLPTWLYQHWGLTEDPGGWLERLGVKERTDGFNPGIFEHPAAYWAALVMRFLRAVVVVALVEEIFWRGFVMRFVCDWEGDYWQQPFGRHRWASYAIVTGLFMAAHVPVDYSGALIYGSLTYLLCVWSKNLGACVVMHAVANFLMGVYIMKTGSYGLW